MPTKQNIGNVSLPASVFAELCKAYMMREKRHLMNECLRQLEATHPSEFRVHWITQWPTNEPERVSVTKAVPKILWDMLSIKWGVKTASELLRYGLYVMYAKRFERDVQFDNEVARGIALHKKRQKNAELPDLSDDFDAARCNDHLERLPEKPPESCDQFVPHWARKSEKTLAKELDLADADARELALVAQLEQQAVLPVGLETVKESSQ